MSIKITLTEEEILGTPNSYELGTKVQNRYWQARRDQEGPKIDEDYVYLNVNKEGLVESITKSEDYDICVICGRESPYLKNVHIDLRKGYIEGAGQGCYQPSVCEHKR